MLWKIVKRIKAKNLSPYETTEETSSSLNPIVDKIETNLRKIVKYLDTLSETFQNINIGITTLNSLNISSLEKHKKYFKNFIYVQLFLDLLNMLCKGILNRTVIQEIPEFAGSQIVKEFTTKYSVCPWNTKVFEFKFFAEPILFLEHLISQNTLIAVRILSEDSERDKDSLLEAIKQRLMYKDYLIALKIENQIHVLQWSSSTNKLMLYLPAETEPESKIKTVLSWYLDYIKTFCNQMLIVKGLFWEEGEYFKTIRQNLPSPEFYRADIKDKLTQILSSAIQKKEKCGILLYGLPGVGKSSSAMAAFCCMNALVVRIDHKPTEGLIAFLDRIQEVPKIILFEEIDVETGGEKSDRIQAILQFLDTSCYDIVIMTANTVKLNPALLRSGRCDLKILCQPPTKEERGVILDSLNQKYKCCENAVLSELVKQTEGFTHADLHTICKLAMLQGRHLINYLPEFISQKDELKRYTNETYM